jgi:hypothetical protein
MVLSLHGLIQINKLMNIDDNKLFIDALDTIAHALQ